MLRGTTLAPPDGLVCDRCGRPNADRYRFCDACNLFVCSGCWEADQAVCLSCARPNLPGPGLVSSAILDTIGTRSAASPAATSRAGRALTGPSGGVVVTTGRASPHSAPGHSPGQSLGALALRALLAAALLFFVVLFAAPLISTLLNGEAAAPQPAPFVAPVEEDVQSGTVATPPARRYVVKSGDTLRSIASSVYGDEERWINIYQANTRTIADPDSLVVGSTLTIPDE